MLRYSRLTTRLLRRVSPLQCRRSLIVSVKVPTMAESISEGTLKQWSKAVGDVVEADEELTSIETDKIDVAVNAPKAGKIIELLAKEDDTVTVGQEIAKLDTEGTSKAEPKQGEQDGKPEDSKTSKDSPKADTSEHGRSEPKAPASAEQPSSSHPQPSSASGDTPTSGNKNAEGKTEKEHTRSVERHEEQSQETEAPSTNGPVSQSSGPGAQTSGREEKRVKMNRMRLRIAERLKQSQNTAASLTTFNEVDMSSLMDLRKLYKDDLLKSGIKLGFMGAFSRACILAMKDVPAVNASIEGANGGDTIVYRDYVDISIAVATEKGLVTPIVRNSEKMSITEIESAITDLGKKARDNKLTLEDMAGGTFTISNGGVFGSLMGTPIINLPQTAVLGLHAIKDRPVAVNGKVEIKPMMYLALTYDHRLLDGREAVTFLVKVKQYIEDPRKMLLR